jgi:hypothetical protein
MNTHRLWESAKNTFVVCAITLLIWLVADQYVLQEQSFQIPVRIVSRNPGRYAAVAKPPHQVTLNVTMVGRRRHLQAFGNAVSLRSLFEAGISDAKPSSPEPQTVSAKDDVLRSIKLIEESHLSIKAVSPETVTVRIDDYVDVPNVAVEPDVGDLQVVNFSCSPEQVSVRLPRFASDLFLNEWVIRPDAEAAIREATTTRPDFQIPLTLSLVANPALGIQITPAKVTLSGIVQADYAKELIGPVQITFSIPDEIQKRFTIVPDPDTQFRQSIEVTGPKKHLDQLDPRDIRAFVDVMAADAEEPGKEIKRPVHYVLPKGFTLAPDSPRHEIVFRLLPRSPAAPTGNG